MTTILRGVSPQTTSELDTDPRNLAAAAAQFPPQATEPAPVAIPQQAMNIQLGGRKRRGGKLFATLAALLIVGALGAAGWFYQEPIKEIAQRFLQSKNPKAEVSEPSSSPGRSSADTAQVTEPKSEKADDEGSRFDPLSKPAPGLPEDKPTPLILQNAGTESGTPMPQASVTSSILGSIPPPPETPPTEIKPAETAPPPVALPSISAPPKAMVVDEDDGKGSSATARHVPGTALGERPDRLVEVTPADSARTASSSSSSAQSATMSPAETNKDVVVRTSPEGKKAAAALLAFFAAKNLAERLPLTLGAENVKSLMERYYAKKDSGAIAVNEIQLLRYDEAPETGGGPHCVFTVASKSWDFPIPVMLQEEGGAYKVDWLAFVEFRDNLLREFLSSFQDVPARFHVGIRRTHYFEDDVPDLADKDAFEIQPPQPTYLGYVFVPKGTPLAADLASRLSWETLTAYVVVELRWKRLGDKKWVELTAVPQLNWYSFPQVAQGKSSPPVPKKGSGGVDIKKLK